jgi:hypothetical protein
VSHHWNVSTGEEYARKKPLDQRYDREAWEKEIDIMDRISYVEKNGISHVGNNPFLLQRVLSAYVLFSLGLYRSALFLRERAAARLISRIHATRKSRR